MTKFKIYYTSFSLWHYSDLALYVNRYIFENYDIDVFQNVLDATNDIYSMPIFFRRSVFNRCNFALSLLILFLWTPLSKVHSLYFRNCSISFRPIRKDLVNNQLERKVVQSMYAQFEE